MKRASGGRRLRGRFVVVLEDTSTTGGSPLEAALACARPARTRRRRRRDRRPCDRREEHRAEAPVLRAGPGGRLADCCSRTTKAGAGFCAEPGPGLVVICALHMWGDGTHGARSPSAGGFMAPMARSRRGDLDVPRASEASRDDLFKGWPSAGEVLFMSTPAPLERRRLSTEPEHDGRKMPERKLGGRPW